MRCLILADERTGLVEKTYSFLVDLGASVEVLDPKLFEGADHPRHFTHIVVIQTNFTLKQTELLGRVLKKISWGTVVLGLLLDWRTIAEGIEGFYIRGLMAVPALPHLERIPIHHNGKGLFVGLTDPFLGKRYGNTAIALNRLELSCEVSAKTTYGEVLAIAENYGGNVFWLNLHEEVLLGNVGKVILKNFLSLKFKQHKLPAGNVRKGWGLW